MASVTFEIDRNKEIVVTVIRDAKFDQRVQIMYRVLASPVGNWQELFPGWRKVSRRTTIQETIQANSERTEWKVRGQYFNADGHDQWESHRGVKKQGSAGTGVIRVGFDDHGDYSHDYNDLVARFVLTEPSEDPS